MRQRLKETSEQTARLTQLSENLNDALSRGDIDQVKILNANYAEAKALQDATRKSVAEASMALMDGFKEIGIVLKDAKDYTDEEKSLITTAEAKAASAKTRLDAAEKGLQEAYKKPTLLGIQRRAVENATTVRDHAKEEFDTLTTAIETARQSAEQLRQNRLQGAEVDATLQAMQSRTVQIVGLVREDISNIEENLQISIAGITTVTTKLQELSTDMENAKADQETANARIASLRETRDGIADKTSSEWQKANADVIAVERERDEAESKHNIAFDLFQNAQAFLEKYKHQEDAQRTALQFNQAFIASLEAANRYRDDIYRSYLGTVKSGDLFRAAEVTDKAGRVIDEDISTDTVTQTAAMRNAMRRRYEDLPEDIRRHQELTEATHQSEAAFQGAMATLIAQAQTAYGRPANYDARGEAPATQ
jgi:hypothetical protein